ncbi:MAG: SpoIIE family protein phosphatase [Methylococcales bacterium]|jgi:sigma-B regulation protein RsbU (phosphoserine phosphatase)|nr:SpoIIE family protein phosphatase [Methylococcales bacterium]
MQLQHKLLVPAEVIVEYSEILIEDCNQEIDIDCITDLKHIKSSSTQLCEFIKTILVKTTKKTSATELKQYGIHVRHEIRIHLNHIIGYSEILLEEAEENNQQDNLEILGRIYNSSQSLLSHMDDILDYSTVSMNLNDDDSNISPDNSMVKNLVDSIKPLNRQDILSEFTGTILIVDDIEMNRDLLETRLQKQGHVVITAENGQIALDIIQKSPLDLIILDIMMPVVNGFQVLQTLKSDEVLKTIPVIIFSALDEVDSIVRCLEMGAEDYLVKPLKPIILKARVQACLEKKQLRDREQMYFNALQKTQNELNAELAEAADYVRSILPQTIKTKDVSANWSYLPSNQLGGDSLGYHWVDDDNFAFYLLDVCGHGVGSALLSVSIMNVLSNNSLAKTDFLNPTDVMLSLNDTFKMENQNGKYFSIWYGVFNKKTRSLSYSCCGHPPAILASNDEQPIELSEGGAAIIGFPNQHYPSQTIQLKNNSSILIFSDGIYELPDENDNMYQYSDFFQFVQQCHDVENNHIEKIIKLMQKLNKSEIFNDDVSLLEVIFH